MAYYGQARTHQPLGEEANIEKQLQQQQQSVQCSASVVSEIKFATADYTDMQLALLLMLMRDAILDSRSYQLVRYWQHSTRERHLQRQLGNVDEHTHILVSSGTDRRTVAVCKLLAPAKDSAWQQQQRQRHFKAVCADRLR